MALPCESERRWSRAIKMIFCLFFLIPMSSAGNRNTNTIFGKKQKLEVQQQLKRLNKPALKSIKSPDGDIIDCIDIYKQPAFDHPLLKNHTIQMRPSSYPKGFSANSKPKFSQPWHLNGRCPKGTIPIRRTKEEDLLRAGSAANYGRKNHIQNTIDENVHQHATLTEDGDRYYGMMAEMNVWNPHTQERDEFSVSQFWMIAGRNGVDLNSIEAGTMADAYTNTGCFNLGCPGFVQDIHGDGNWWLTIADRFDLGYWPSSLFPLLSDTAEAVKWGGEVINLNKDGQHTTTQMGSGHFAEEGPNKACFFKNLNVIDGKKLLRAPSHTHTFIPKPNCYNLLDYGDYFYFGGPGRNPNCP
uniref:Neprosin PEP catalytic domain-containing protein n=1 Tax=Quercus lobata TaxID=97700 RepID=A0A7N2LEZ7_QUELO